MPSSIDICSNALMLIGDNPISSFQDAGAGAQVAAALYQVTKEELLAEHPWSFALKQQRLNRLSQIPDKLTNYQYAFQLPTDLIRVWNVQDHTDYILIDGLLYSNQTTLLCTYIYNVADTSLPPHVVKALQYKLAEDFAMSVTEDQQKSQLMAVKASTQTAKAMGIDSQGRPQMGIIDSPLVDARFSGTNSADRRGY